MAVALFGPPGRWIQNLDFTTTWEPVPQEDEAASEEKKRRKEEWYYLWELEEMFGQKEAHELIEKGQFKKKELKYVTMCIITDV